MEIVVDAEFNDLYNPSVVWCVVCRSREDGEVRKFIRPDRNERSLKNFLSNATKIVGHNFLEYDLKYLNSLLNLEIDPLKVFDTLITSRFLHYNIPGGHSLKEWGTKLGVSKLHADETQEFFQVYSQELVDRCVSDVEVTDKLYSFFQKYIDSTNEKALDIEHKTCLVCQDISNNGFYFDISKARELHKEIKSKLDTINQEIATAFPPRAKLIREVTPKATKTGTISLVDFRWLPPEERDMSQFHVGSPFSLIEWKEFNPGSHKQIVERLNEYEWKPTDRTKTHVEFLRERSSIGFNYAENERSKQTGGRNLSKESRGNGSSHERAEYFRQFGWKVNETNLNTLPPGAPPQAKLLKDWILLDSRRSTLEEWFNAYRNDTGRIHGRYNHIGAWTHRKSHAVPNMANIPRSSNEYYGRSFRELWCVPKGKLLIGCDATGIQLRVLAHYIGDPGFTREVIEGDVHELNRNTLGTACKSRANAKTFIYAWLLGAGIGKISEILGCSHEEGNRAVDNFIRKYKGLEHLKNEIIPRDARRGYFVGFDSRKICCSSEHLMLSGYLQAGESIIMKHACLDWRTKLKKERVPFWQVNDVHDEWQTETIDNRELAYYIGNIQVDSIRVAGEKFNLRCPMDGEYSIGTNWYETH